MLRAADVIPPFNQDVTQANEPANAPKEPTPEPSQSQPPERERPGRRVREAAAGAGDTSVMAWSPTDVEIPTFDLADDMLAEHRQMASRRRRAPGQMQAEPGTQPVPAAVMTRVIEPPSQDLREVHRAVAEIVARDIQRLCSQPGRTPRG